MKFDIKILEKYVENDLLQVNYHDEYLLSIWNYTQKCQFDQAWDDITLNMRGTILDESGNVIAKGFSKFFNIEELKPEEIPDEPFDVYSKIDGSLGICFHYQNEWHIATRGSFKSDQAIKALKIFENYKIEKLYKECHYLVEIIYPENRICVDYGVEEKLVLLSVIRTDILEELSYDVLRAFSELTFIPIVPKYDGFTDYKMLKSIIKDNEEGFVVRFKSGFRIKIKGEEYIRLHRLLTNFSNLDIWKALKEGKEIDLDRVPDEFYEWVKNTKDKMVEQYKFIEDSCRILIMYYVLGEYGVPEKKEYALWVQKQKREYQSILFKIYDGKSYDHIIWNIIRPTYQKPFWNKENVL